jgi:FlaA1/EpsC-like NDP-sugar epimerase
MIAPMVRAVALLMAVLAMATVTFFIVSMVVMAAVTMTRSVPRVTMTLILVTIIVMRTVAVIQQRAQRKPRDQWRNDIVIVVGAS